MSIQEEVRRIIGTVVPLSALWSENDPLPESQGKIDVGFIFLSWLEATSQHAWQFLPLSQTHLEPGSRDIHVPSPYKGYGVGFDERYLSGKWAEMSPTDEELYDFLDSEKSWIKDYSLFCAIRDHFGTDDWTLWEDKSLQTYDARAVREWEQKLADRVRYHSIQQWRLHTAFYALRAQARSKGIILIGDLPFYVPLQSPLVWAHQGCFEFTDRGIMKQVSGIPDGPKAHYGRQVWGHPLYNWSEKKVRKSITSLWMLRISYFSRFYDTMRLDHAKGLFNYGAMSTTGGPDEIRKGPGEPMLEEIITFARTIGLNLFAEDAGDRLEELRETLQRLRVPGIRILRFAYNEKKKKFEHDYSDVRNYPDDSYAYSSTHDTITIRSYADALSDKEARHLCAHMGITYSDDKDLFAARLRQAVIGSTAKYAMIPIQDWLLSKDRINVPGTEKAVGDPNWRYRVPLPVEGFPKPSYV